MSNDFKTLVDFRDQFGPEVSGRSHSQPYSEDSAKLLRFASGKCEEPERTEICEMLRSNPAWLRVVADHVKKARKVTAKS